jgi:hypothetical protein
VADEDVSHAPRGTLHHVELWVPDLARATTQWGWLLGQLGYTPFQDWPAGRSWRLRTTYLANTDGFEVELAADDET